MAKDPSRTERATPKRRQKAREEGSVLRVPDLDSTVILWGNFFLFVGLWTATLTAMVQACAFFFKRAGQAEAFTELGLRGLSVDLLTIVLRVLLPFLAANFLMALANQFVQHGFKPSAKPLTPKFTKLNPASGFKRIISAKSMVDILKSLLKFLIVAWVAYSVLGQRFPMILATMKLPINQSVAFLQETLFVLYRNVMVAMLVLAAADFLFQRHQFEENIKMTKQEVKDEAKDSEGNPEIKGRQRSLIFASAMHRIMAQVPKASVVITNPTHVAVALRYDAQTAAPVCLAKGLDHLALKIRERAKATGVPIVENPPLARALYREVDLERPIPQELYQAVAQVLAFVYRLKGVA